MKRKRLCIAAVAVVIAGAGLLAIRNENKEGSAAISAPETRYAAEETATALASGGNNETETVIQPIEDEVILSGVTLAEYVKGLYTANGNPEYDEMVYEAFREYEANAGQDKSIVIWRGDSYEEAYQRQMYINRRYGYTDKIHVKMGTVNDGRYCVYFPDTLNAEEAIQEYIAEVEKAKAAAETVKGSTPDETACNIIDWVKGNNEFYYGYDINDTVACISHYYGAYSGNLLLCNGYAIAIYQLCSMDGIKAEILDELSPEGINHAANTIEFSDGVKYVDATLTDPISDELAEGYSMRTIALPDNGN